MIFVGVDWAEEHHDVDVRDEHGGQLAATRVRHGVVGLGELHDVLAGLVEHPDEVVVGIETDRGLLCRRLSLRDIESTPSTRALSIDIAIVSRSRGPSRIRATRWCWLSLFAATVIIIDVLPAHRG